MPSRDANGATWYMLRYAHDFAPRAADPVHDPSPPQIDPTLLYDERRGVLELATAPPDKDAEPPPGVVVDVDGTIYLVDPRGRLVVRRCDGSTKPLPCEPGVLAKPAGLAIDRRGLLYVADPAAHRVVVLLPDDGSVQAILNGGVLVDPVDVAVAPSGTVYVADRAGGKIAIYSGRLQRAGTIVPPIAAPRPVGVMIDDDGTILVADARHPRLLRFTPSGEPLADEPLASAMAGVPAEVALDALERAYGRRLPRFLAGACPPDAPDRDGGARLAEVHRALRLLALRLAAGFAEQGVFISAALDGGAPGVQWHRVIVDADLPAGSTLVVETATSDDRSPLALDWHAPVDRAGRPLPITGDRGEQLVQSPPGRWLRVRVTLRGDGRTTPSVRSLKLLYPRISYLASLPRVFSRDPEARRFLDRFLALFERSFTRIEDAYEEFSRELDPDGAPRELIDWLACLVDLAFDPSWSLDRRRALVAHAMELYRTRGTPAGLAHYVEIYTGVRPAILEGFLARPARPVYLGRPGSILGCGLPIASCRGGDATPEEQLYCRFAHRFTVLLHLDDRCDREVVARVVDRIVSAGKPAHTEHRIAVVQPGARVGFETTVGLGFVVGADEAPMLPISGPERRILGTNAVIGQGRPHVRRLLPGL